MCRDPIAVRTELGPTIGRNGDSPVSEGASSGLAVNRERTWSGWLVITGPSGTTPRVRKTSPSSRRALNTNSIWRWLNRITCSARGSAITGGPASCSASGGSTGPAGDGGACPTRPPSGNSLASVSASAMVGMAGLQVT